MESVATKENVDGIVSSVERKESLEIKSARRSGKTALILAVSAGLREKGIDHQIAVASDRQLAAYEESGAKNVVRQGAVAPTVEVMILDEPDCMARGYVEAVRGRVPVVVAIGAPV